jgi:hypothetical protein
MTTSNLTTTLSRDGYTTILWDATEINSYVYFDAEMVSNLNPGVTTYRAKVDPRVHIQVNDNAAATDPGPIDPVPARYGILTWDELSDPLVIQYQVFLDGRRVATRLPGGTDYAYKTDWLESGAHTLDVYSVDEAGNLSPMKSIPFDIESEPNPIQGLTITDGSAGGNIDLVIIAPAGI